MRPFSFLVRRQRGNRRAAQILTPDNSAKTGSLTGSLTGSFLAVPEDRWQMPEWPTTQFAYLWTGQAGTQPGRSAGLRHCSRGCAGQRPALTSPAPDNCDSAAVGRVQSSRGRPRGTPQAPLDGFWPRTMAGREPAARPRGWPATPPASVPPWRTSSATPPTASPSCATTWNALSSCSAVAKVSPYSGSRRHDAAELSSQPRLRRAQLASTSFPKCLDPPRNGFSIWAR